MTTHMTRIAAVLGLALLLPAGLPAQSGPATLESRTSITATPLSPSNGRPVVAVRYAYPDVGLPIELRATSCGMMLTFRASPGAQQLVDTLSARRLEGCPADARRAPVAYAVVVHTAGGRPAVVRSVTVTVDLPRVAKGVLPPPENARVTLDAKGARVLTWDHVRGAAGYQLERAYGTGAWPQWRTLAAQAGQSRDALRSREKPRYRIRTLADGLRGGAWAEFR